MIINLILDIFIVVGTAICVVREFFTLPDGSSPSNATNPRLQKTSGPSNANCPQSQDAGEAAVGAVLTSNGNCPQSQDAGEAAVGAVLTSNGNYPQSQDAGSPSPAANKPSSKNITPSKSRIFRYYTTDSNIFSALVSLISIILIICNAPTEGWLMALRLSATVSVTITFLTVIFFLAPTQGFKLMFGGPSLYMHLLGPLAAIASLYLKSSGNPMPYIFILWGVLTVPVYGLIYYIMVIVKGADKGGWKDFYGFNRGGHWKISIIIMGAAALLVTCAHFFIYNLLIF